MLKESQETMQIVNGIKELKSSTKPRVVAIGNFDGVHRGHVALLKEARERADRVGGELLALTFRPHPRVVLQGPNAVKVLTTYDERAKLLLDNGVDLVVEEPFTRDFASISPADFFRVSLVEGIRPRAIVVGYNFGFGKGREGSSSALQEFGKRQGTEVIVLEACVEGGQKVSSSQVREHLLNARVTEANQLLGYSFSYEGRVFKGDQRGRTIGFPTANLTVPDKIQLPLGVYATRFSVHGQLYDSVTNIGERPTFQKPNESRAPVWIETHVLDHTLDLYGADVRVEFHSYLRQERKFSDVNQLKTQIANDVLAAIDRLRS